MQDTQLSILDTRFILGGMGSMQEYAHLLRSEMERQGIEGQQIADALGIGQSMVSDIVNAKKKNPPSQDVFKGIGKILGISQRRMLEALGYMDPETDDSDDDLNIPQDVREALRRVQWNERSIQDAVFSLGLVERGQASYAPRIDPSKYD